MVAQFTIGFANGLRVSNFSADIEVGYKNSNLSVKSKCFWGQKISMDYFFSNRYVSNIQNVYWDLANSTNSIKISFCINKVKIWNLSKFTFITKGVRKDSGSMECTAESSTDELIPSCAWVGPDK